MSIDSINSPEEIESIAAPTPVAMNTKVAAERIREDLEKSGIAVRLEPVEDLHDWREILQHDLIIIGTSTHFWNVSWQTKRLFDDLFLRIYVSQGRARGKLFAIFTHTTIEPSGERALAAMESAITDCGGKIALRLILTEALSLDQARQEIDKFSAGLAVLAR